MRADGEISKLIKSEIDQFNYGEVYVYLWNEFL